MAGTIALPAPLFGIVPVCGPQALSGSSQQVVADNTWVRVAPLVLSIAGAASIISLMVRTVAVHAFSRLQVSPRVCESVAGDGPVGHPGFWRKLLPGSIRSGCAGHA